MYSFRYIRRRGFGILWKSVVICCFLLVLIEITNSHPRGSNFKPDTAPVNAAVPESNNALKQPEVKHPLGEQLTKSVIETQEGHRSPRNSLQTVVPKVDRTGKFYENILVHFDLKGAPPKVSYFKDLLKLIQESGATGILLEWEDMFPWEGQLKNARNTDAYSMEDVKAILDTAKILNLDIIPLVQTFGHLEWFLKLDEFQKHRSNPAYPNVLCLGDEEGVAIVKDAIRQIVEVHKPYGIPHFHIGADEAFEFGVCEKSKDWISSNGENGGKQLLALTHLKDIALYTKNLIGGEVTILAWHDMLKDFDGRLIKQLNLGDVVQPVVWDYSENIVTMPDMSFSMISENFPVIWASSAYKGANFPSVRYIDIGHYEKNNLEWIRTKQRQEKKFKKFGGIILAGWQRYDHMAALTEILPMGTPSMILQIRTAANAPTIDQNNNRQEAARLLGCSSFQVASLNLISNECNFPGWQVYQGFQGNAQQTIQNVEEELGKNHHVMGWLSRYSRKHNISQNWYLGQIDGFLSPLVRQLENTENGLKAEMSKLFFDNTIEEFLYITIGETTDKFRNLQKEARRLSKLRTYPKRHFAIKREEEL